MATAKHSAPPRNIPWASVLFGCVLVAGLIVWLWGDMLKGYALAGSAYGAKGACSCRFVAERSLSSCESDFLPGMEFVFLSEDSEARSVTAFVPLIASETATYRDGFGCVLPPMSVPYNEG